MKSKFLVACGALAFATTAQATVTINISGTWGSQLTAKSPVDHVDDFNASVTFDATGSHDNESAAWWYPSAFSFNFGGVSADSSTTPFEGYYLLFAVKNPHNTVEDEAVFLLNTALGGFTFTFNVGDTASISPSLSADPSFYDNIELAGAQMFDTSGVDHLYLYDQLHITSITTSGETLTIPGPALLANVPEPSSWALMLTGFGAVGYGMRKRKVAFA